jgi:lipopolysaccharide/colanic/teichoic acid biosynthesis glycosyltransferase
MLDAYGEVVLAGEWPQPAPTSSSPNPHYSTNQNGLSLYFDEEGPVAVPASAGRTVQLALKRLLDIVGALLALILLLPLLLLVAITIKATSPGPVLFVQNRPGLATRPFRILKFRTMHADRCDEAGTRQALEGDDRVTPLGRFLRRTSIDELPQLFNVLRGDMSLIGPRPHAAGMMAAGMLYEELAPYYFRRYAMRPGISGWAQAHGLRGPTIEAQSARSRIDHDLAYIQSFSLLLDLKIVWLTIKYEFLSGTGV